MVIDRLQGSVRHMDQAHHYLAGLPESVNVSSLIGHDSHDVTRLGIKMQEAHQQHEQAAQASPKPARIARNASPRVS